MKVQKLIGLLFLVSLAFSKIEAAQVIFAGTISSPTDAVPKLIFKLNELTKEQSTFKLNLKADDTFIVSIDVAFPQIIQFEYGDFVQDIFVSPTSKKVNWHLDAAKKEIVFEGEEARDHGFWKNFEQYYLRTPKEYQAYESEFLTTWLDPDIARRATAYDIDPYFQYLEDQLQDQRLYLDNSPYLSRSFRDLVRKEIYWRYETNKLAYFLVNKKHIAKNKLSRYWTKYALLQTVDITDEKALSFFSYQNLLSAFIHYLHLESGIEDNAGLDFYRFIERNLDGRGRYFMQAQLLLKAYEKGALDLVRRKHKGYQRFNPYPPYSETLQNTFGNSLEHISSKIVPNFSFINEKNEALQLNDYQNKVVFISVWASWCAPCLKGFRETYALRKELERKGVVFLNVNIDKEESTWRRSLRSHAIAGENVYGMDLKTFKDEMGFTTLPYYIIVDKVGRMQHLSTDDLQTSKDDFVDLLKN